MPKKSVKKTAKKAVTKKAVKKTVKKKAAKKPSRRDPVVLAFDESEDFTMSVVGKDGDIVPDRMMIEKMMRQFGKKLQMLADEHGSLDGFDGGELTALLNGMSMPGADSPAEQAQEIVFQAFESRSSKKRIELAKKAIGVDPDCVDALILLAEETGKTRRSRIELYRKAVAAGERSLGAEFIEENTGYFWGMHETRPYMRALEGLAANLRADGELLESLATYRKMLILNPGDNQGVRYTALYLLIETDQDGSAEELYESYSEDDGSAWWRFGRALLNFRKSGDTPTTRASLRDAIKYNPFVPQYLLEIKQRPPTPPGHYGIGDENEAMYYYDAAIRAWAHTVDVYDWLLDVSKEFFETENKKRK